MEGRERRREAGRHGERGKRKVWKEEEREITKKTIYKDREGLH